jgi:hypothetical protein
MMMMMMIAYVSIIGGIIRLTMRRLDMCIRASTEMDDGVDVQCNARQDIDANGKCGVADSS